MTLRFDLGPFEELHLGKCVIKNSHQKALFVLEGEIPIVRGKDFLPEESIRFPIDSLYHCVQQMYLEEAYEKYQGSYLQFAAQTMKEDPTIHSYLETADQLIRSGNFYKALKGLKKLVRADAFITYRAPSENYVPRANGWKKAQ